MTDDDRWPDALHEAGPAWADWTWGRMPALLSIRPGLPTAGDGLVTGASPTRMLDLGTSLKGARCGGQSGQRQQRTVYVSPQNGLVRRFEGDDPGDRIGALLHHARLLRRPGLMLIEGPPRGPQSEWDRAPDRDPVGDSHLRRGTSWRRRLGRGWRRDARCAARREEESDCHGEASQSASDRHLATLHLTCIGSAMTLGAPPTSRPGGWVRLGVPSRDSRRGHPARIVYESGDFGVGGESD